MVKLKISLLRKSNARLAAVNHETMLISREKKHNCYYSQSDFLIERLPTMKTKKAFLKLNLVQLSYLAKVKSEVSTLREMASPKEIVFRVLWEWHDLSKVKTAFKAMNV